MRAGKLDQTITLRSVTYTDDGFGGQEEVVTDHATLRAQIVDMSTDEYMRAWGAATEELRIFRTRFLDDVTIDMKVVHDGMRYEIKQIKPIGRRRGLELRCTNGAG